MGCSGCATISEELDRVPEGSGDLEYNRNGAYTSAVIKATNFNKNKKEVTADELSINLNYGVLGSYTFTVTDYKRKREDN